MSEYFSGQITCPNCGDRMTADKLQGHRSVGCKTELDRFKAENERLKEYAQHKYECSQEWEHCIDENGKGYSYRKCTCGLSELLNKGE